MHKGLERFCNCGKLLINTQKIVCSRKCLYESKDWRKKVSEAAFRRTGYSSKICTVCYYTFYPINTRNRICLPCRKTWGKTRTQRLIIHRYGLIQRDIDNILKSQKNKCALCYRPAKFIDHCYRTGQIRGILCPGCNSALNRMEIPGWSRSAIEYLKVLNPMVKGKFHQDRKYNKFSKIWKVIGKDVIEPRVKAIKS